MPDQQNTVPGIIQPQAQTDQIGGMDVVEFVPEIEVRGDIELGSAYLCRLSSPDSRGRDNPVGPQLGGLENLRHMLGLGVPAVLELPVPIMSIPIAVSLSVSQH
jgi:hypothetical protein